MSQDQDLSLKLTAMKPQNSMKECRESRSAQGHCVGNSEEKVRKEGGGGGGGFSKCVTRVKEGRKEGRKRSKKEEVWCWKEGRKEEGRARG